MNNYRLLNIINPQFVYCNDCGQDENNNKYMVIIPALFGYDKNVACSLYITISKKLLDSSDNNKLEMLINDMQEDVTILLRGYDDFVPGIDYYLSESLYEYIKSSSWSETSDDSSGVLPDPDPNPDPNPNPDPDEPWEFDWSGIIILHGKDINRLLNINRYNIDRVSEILALEKIEKENRRRVLIMTRPDISKYLTEEELDEIDEDISSRIVMKDYVIYDRNLNFEQDVESYKYLYDINNKDMRNLEWFYNMNNLVEYINNSSYSREELCNIPKTFFTIINDNAIVQNLETVKNQIYDRIIKYYVNGGYDDTLINLNLILNSTVPTTLTSTKLNCGCANSNTGDGINGDTINGLTSCVDMYKNAINEWLKKMLADDDFYKDWFFTIISGMCPTPNTEMIDSLINLLTEYVDLNLGGANNNGRFNPNRGYDIFNHMNCCNDCSGDDTYKNIILHYIEVLKAVKNNDIDANKNMIKIYGEEFAGILPYLTC